MGAPPEGAKDGNSRSSRDFLMSTGDEPHAIRRGEILRKHPEIKELMGYEWRTKYLAAATVVLQVFMAWLTLEWSWAPYLVAVYVVGATANHSLFLVIHELAHNLGAQRVETNRMIAMLANMPICGPYCITFKPYHMEHHRYQGQDGVDTDIPSYLEGFLITKTSLGYWDHTLRKAVFLTCQIFGYAFRPMFIKPTLVPVDSWLALNWVSTFGFVGLTMALIDKRVAMYFILSTLLAGSIHPTAGHFIAEHYVMDGAAETYSYYGPLNYLAYNVGYHNEHHDFPNIPWSNLPKVRQIAPEFYNSLPECKSWPGTLMRYIFDDSISPYSRVKRLPKRA